MNKDIDDLIENIEDELYLIQSELDKVCEHEILYTERNLTLFTQVQRLINQAKSQLLFIEINGKPEEN